MSGHSKWAKIKRAKGAKDAQRGALFTKLAKAITIAASEGGGDPSMNFTLRLAIDKAKEANMPSDNIERSIKKGTGEIEGGKLTKIGYEAYGPGSVGIIIDCTTDNGNRTYQELRNLIEGNNGKVAEAGAVSWGFVEKGFFRVGIAKLKKSEKYGQSDSYELIDKDEASLEIMEIEGVEDLNEGKWIDNEDKEIDVLEITADKSNFAKVDSSLREHSFQVISAELIKEATNPVEIDDSTREKIQKLIEILDEHDDVENVWIGAK